MVRVNFYKLPLFFLDIIFMIDSKVNACCLFVLEFILCFSKVI